jgi:hypothetical protein
MGRALFLGRFFDSGRVEMKIDEMFFLFFPDSHGTG